MAGCDHFHHELTVSSHGGQFFSHGYIHHQASLIWKYDWFLQNKSKHRLLNLTWTSGQLAQYAAVSNHPIGWSTVYVVASHARHRSSSTDSISQHRHDGCLTRPGWSAEMRSRWYSHSLVDQLIWDWLDTVTAWLISWNDIEVIQLQPG